jgi:mRNA-degrading endonuclease YafQ of YafQ-DinJ toxin-antitoxin module
MYIVEISSLAKRKIKKLKGVQKENFDKVLEKLKINPFDSTLHTHKLSGGLEEVYSCRLDYSDRLLFIFIIEKTILVVDIGNHDEVYK